MRDIPIYKRPEFLQSLLEMRNMSLGLAAWGLVTGVAMIDSGLSIPMALLMSFTVYAGGAQLAVLPLLAADAALWVIWLTTFCVNLRFVIFSASWRPFFAHYALPMRAFASYMAVDMSYVLFMKRYGDPKNKEPIDPKSSMAYYWGGVCICWLSWHIPALIGIFMAQYVPSHWGLGFAGTMALLALVCSLMGKPATWVAAATAGCVALLTFSLPFQLNIVMAILSAIVVGLLLERQPRTHNHEA